MYRSRKRNRLFMKFGWDQKVGVSLASLSEPVESQFVYADSQQGLWLVARHSIL